MVKAQISSPQFVQKDLGRRKVNLEILFFVFCTTAPGHESCGLMDTRGQGQSRAEGNKTEIPGKQ
jgi:hypothetical protein